MLEILLNEINFTYFILLVKSEKRRKWTRSLTGAVKLEQLIFSVVN